VSQTGESTQRAILHYCSTLRPCQRFCAAEHEGCCAPMRMYRSHGSPRPTSRELLLWYSKPNFHHRNRHPVRSRSVSHIVVCGEYHVLRNPQKPAKNARSAFGVTHRASESERGRVIEFWSSTQKREGGLLASCVYCISNRHETPTPTPPPPPPGYGCGLRRLLWRWRWQEPKKKKSNQICDLVGSCKFKTTLKLY
jgi:hypothetical protein